MAEEFRSRPGLGAVGSPAARRGRGRPGAAGHRSDGARIGTPPPPRPGWWAISGLNPRRPAGSWLGGVTARQEAGEGNGPTSASRPRADAPAHGGGRSRARRGRAARRAVDGDRLDEVAADRRRPTAGHRAARGRSADSAGKDPSPSEYGGPLPSFPTTARTAWTAWYHFWYYPRCGDPDHRRGVSSRWERSTIGPSPRSSPGRPGPISPGRMWWPWWSISAGSSVPT